MVDSYHPFWWWRGCITYLLLRECLLHISFSVKMIHRLVAYLRTSSVKRGGKPNCFLKRNCSLAHGLCLKFNTSFTLAFFNSLDLLCCIGESFSFGWPDLLFRKVAFSRSHPHTICSFTNMALSRNLCNSVQRFVEVQVNQES